MIELRGEDNLRKPFKDEKIENKLKVITEKNIQSTIRRGDKDGRLLVELISTKSFTKGKPEVINF